MMPITDTAMYRLCHYIYTECQAYQDHVFNPDLKQLHDDTLAYLQFGVDENDDDIVVTYVLKKKDFLDG